jgi:hypothetical protein
MYTFDPELTLVRHREMPRMKIFQLYLFVLTLGVCFACSAFAESGRKTLVTMQAACDRLRAIVAEQSGAAHGVEEYRCEDGTDTLADGYFVFSLRSNYPTPKGAGADWVGSSLVGWYAVRTSDGQARNWDVANFKLGAVIK